jgi:Flp pilus assembly protein TadG
VILFALVFMGLAAFVIDGGLSISKRERAADIAEQAARYAAEDINQEQLRNADKTVINGADCPGRVREFARQSGLSAADAGQATCVTVGARRVTVEIQITYEPMLTGFFYDHAVTVHATGTAEVETG